MNIKDIVENENVDFTGIKSSYFLIGLLSAFENRFQAVADSFFKQVTWKQFFAIICIKLCKESPTINELSEIMGSSHQNVKQILIKLEKKGFVQMILDEKDKRKQRVIVTEKCNDFCKSNDAESQICMERTFEGVSQEQILTTIQTIAMMERNIKNI